MDEKNNIFRQKSMERLSSPEQLNDYLRVTNPSVWVVLAAVIFLLAGLFIWSFFTSVKSTYKGEATVSSGVMTVAFDNTQNVTITPDMTVTAGGKETEVVNVTTDTNGRTLVTAYIDLPAGSYDASICYRQTQMLSLLFN